MPSALTGEEIKSRLISALQMLVKKDSHLLTVDANERSITHRLAVYLEGLFPGWDVDCEYNRNLETVKRLSVFKKHIDNDNDHGSSVFPDIIIHHRGPNGENLVVIEAKKSSNPSRHMDDTCKCDRCKLKCLKDELGYQFAYFLEIPVKERFADLNSDAVPQIIEEVL